MIIQLSDRLRKWANWWAACLDCGWFGISVRPSGAPKLCECPDCGAMRVVRTAPADSMAGIGEDL